MDAAEKIPLAEIAHSLQLRESWLQQCVNVYYSTVAQQVQVQPESVQRLGLRCSIVKTLSGQMYTSNT